ncbi:hypothetical protein TMatcc_001048 [Talaromyces marneffei ATCC 18224]
MAFLTVFSTAFSTALSTRRHAASCEAAQTWLSTEKSLRGGEMRRQTKSRRQTTERDKLERVGKRTGQVYGT